MLTQKRLKELLHYCPETGVFTWKIKRHNKVKIGDVAGSIDSKGYWSIGIDNKRYRVHRLAILYVNGCFPKHVTDHKDRNKLNNRYDNLRAISNQHNLHNSGNCINNSSGVKGVSWNKTCQKWVAQIKINYKVKYLGLYSDFAEAVCTRLAAEECLGWQGHDTNSPAFQYVRELTSA